MHTYHKRQFQLRQIDLALQAGVNESSGLYASGDVASADCVHTARRGAYGKVGDARLHSHDKGLTFTVRKRNESRNTYHGTIREVVCVLLVYALQFRLYQSRSNMLRPRANPVCTPVIVAFRPGLFLSRKDGCTVPIRTKTRRGSSMTTKFHAPSHLQNMIIIKRRPTVAVNNELHGKFEDWFHNVTGLKNKTHKLVQKFKSRFSWHTFLTYIPCTPLNAMQPKVMHRVGVHP